MLSFFNIFLWDNKSNFTKIIIIFLVGLSSRTLVHIIFDVNVFSDFTNYISLLYYFVFSIFAVLIYEILEYFKFCIIPNLIIDFISSIVSRIIFICNNLNNLNFKNFKLFITYITFYFNNKITLNGGPRPMNDNLIQNNKDSNTLVMFSEDKHKTLRYFSQPHHNRNRMNSN